MRLSARLRNDAVLVLASLILLFPVSATERLAASSKGLDADIEQFNMIDLEAALRTMPAGPDHDYFAGILSNADNHVDESIQLLNRALPAMRKSRPDRAVAALRALADDYNKVFRYGDAASAYEDLINNFSSHMSAQDLKDVKDDLPLAKILSHVPAQTIAWDGPVVLRTKRNPLDSQNAALTVNGVQGPWLLDTGANLSVVSQSFAQRLHLDLLPGAAQTQAGLTGIENPVRAALLPTLQIAGATLHNVVVMVLPDSNLNINLGKSTYQIDGILGYPVFQALGKITFFHDGKFEARGTEFNWPGARMFMRRLSPIVECRVEGKTLSFAFDTGASDTTLFIRYFREFRSESRHWKKQHERTGGAGGVVTREVYVQPELRLGIGDKTAVLKDVSIYTESTGAGNDERYGNLGEDVPNGFESFTLDFGKMTFTLGKPLPKHQLPENKSSPENPSVKE